MPNGGTLRLAAKPESMAAFTFSEPGRNDRGDKEENFPAALTPKPKAWVRVVDLHANRGSLGGKITWESSDGKGTSFLFVCSSQKPKRKAFIAHLEAEEFLLFCWN
jgi:hypothetical protein